MELRDSEIRPGVRVDALFDDTLGWQAAHVQTTREVGEHREYYVAFRDFDARNDKWVTLGQLRWPSLWGFRPPNEADEQQAPQQDTQAVTRKRTRGQASLEPAPAATQDMSLQAQERSYASANRVKNIAEIVLGSVRVDAWYFAPFPADFGRRRRLYVCPCCLKYMRWADTYRKHLKSCAARNLRPPGAEIYRDTNVSVMELDGATHTLYAQNLSLLSKLFLDHKTVYFDVAPFNFYCLYETEEVPKTAPGYTVVAPSVWAKPPPPPPKSKKTKRVFRLRGFFSKEKSPRCGNNLACILVFPFAQRKGYGRFLMGLSYALSMRAGKLGSPERPLSDLGRRAYHRFWAHRLLDSLLSTQLRNDEQAVVPVVEVAHKCGMTERDAVAALQKLGLVRWRRGRHELVCSAATARDLLAQFAPKPEHTQFDESKMLL